MKTQDPISLEAETGWPLIVVIDDEPLVCNLFQAVIPELGCRIATFNRGEAALAWLEENRRQNIRVVISDYHMTGMNGAKTLNLARRFLPAAQLVLMSGTFANDLPELASKHSFDRFLTKPFTLLTVRKLVMELTRKGDPVRGPTVEPSSPARCSDQEAAHRSSF